MTKREKELFKAYGITVESEKLVSPYGLIAPLLKNNNRKVGKKVYTFGLLPTNRLFESEFGIVPGTCPCTCERGYCTRGCYNFPDNKTGNIIKTLLAYKYLNWVKAAIQAQLEYITEKAEKDGTQIYIRIHDTGDFFGIEYVNMWIEIIKLYPGVKFWTYTKTQFENAFDGLPNANIVKSVIPGIGYNFGHIDYILNAYKQLKATNENVYICRCGIDPEQHCENCSHCATNKYVLFIEHSTEYKAEKDPMFETIKSVINSQE